MTQKDKDLLLKDLCARIPYSVKAQIPCEPTIATIVGIDIQYIGGCIIIDYSNSIDNLFPIEEIKLYLRSFKDMTVEEREELSHYENSVQITDFYYSHHIDCRSFIEKGLAIRVTKENNPYESKQI